MLAELPQLSKDWQEVIGGPLGLGVGINTGVAQVGNTGSKHKFHYAPLGHTVNLASRVEGATKHFGVQALITGSTRQLIGDRFATRRLGRARVVGMSTPVEIHELYAEQASTDWLRRRNAFEAALKLYEAGRFSEVCRALYPILATQSGDFDVPSLDLVNRATQCIKTPPSNFEPIVDLASK
jgi:adenylate cyclase